MFLYTKMRNVAGLSTSEAQKSSDMFGKCRYLDEITGGRGVIFATGTPISNSMTEMYTLMRYLQYNTLQQKGLTHFDAWASTFGETTTAIELAPEGTGYRARTRFAKFFNLPELMAMFKEAADIKTSDQLHLPVPDAKFETVVVKPSEIQQDMVQALSERAAEVHSGSVDPSVDNMLKITSDGRKIGLDQRLMNSALPDDPNSKLNACVNNVLRILLFLARAACHKRAALATYRRIGGLIAIIPKDWKYLRGDIYYADMEPHIGSEQGGTRPVVVLQNDVGNRYAPTLIVATVTSRTEKKRYQPTHVLIAHNTAFEKPSVVQLEQIFTIDKSRIQRFLGQTTRHEMRRIEEALMNSLEINEWDRRNADE